LPGIIGSRINPPVFWERFLEDLGAGHESDRNGHRTVPARRQPHVKNSASATTGSI
jgi:hypothetical protein